MSNIVSAEAKKWPQSNLLDLFDIGRGSESYGIAGQTGTRNFVPLHKIRVLKLFLTSSHPVLKLASKIIIFNLLKKNMFKQRVVLQRGFLYRNTKAPAERSRLSFRLLAFLMSLAFLSSVAPSSDAQVEFSFRDKDVIAIIGNGLADRMQHSPWVESVLQNELKTKQLRFRNMSFSGDVVNRRPRSKGFTDDLAYLNHVAPDVVFVFYGYNESFQGVDNASGYTAELVKLVNRYRIERKKADDVPRFVLFSPIAFEDTGDPNLPDGAEENKNLAAYTVATRQAAELLKCSFVDLFTPTQALFESSAQRYTINGIHLNADGYKELSKFVSSELLGQAGSTDNLENVYAAILNKNWHWHNRYRATDGNDIWGSRSTLSFVDGQTNAEVLVRELEQLDVMTANRDPAIWAAAAGKEFKIDDSNVPPHVKVTSNVGGGSKSSDALKEGSTDYLTPEESLARIEVPEGFELNLFASEVQFPDLANPVQMQVDSKGRLWAASWNSYPKWRPGDEMIDSLMIFEDTDNDGKADVRKIFAHIHNPLGFEFWGGGVIVTSGPDLWFLKDTDGDDKADVRFPIVQGLGTSDTHHAANNLVMGPDGGIYWQSGIFLMHNHETPWKQNLNTGESGLYRFDPRTHSITPIAANSPNPHGTSFDYWGYCFANDGTGGRSFQVRPEGKGFRMHKLLEKEFRPVTANAILSSEHFPEDMQQDFLILNVIGFLGVKQYDLDRDGKGVKQTLGNAWGTPVQALLDGKDKNFRPTDAVIGDDGALYVSDWHNAIIGHMQHNIRDPSRDHKHGRIFRLTVKNRPLQKSVKIDGQPIEALLENLKHPTNSVRHRTRVELSKRDSEQVLAAAKTWAASFDPNDEEEAHHLLEALWLYQQNNAQNDEILQKLLGSSVAHATMAAKTVNHFWNNLDIGADGFSGGSESDFVKFAPPKHLSEQDQKVYQFGAEIYQREAHCATCHQAHGKGLGNTYPTLVGSPWVLGSKERLTKTVLHGLWGKMTVAGKTFDPARGTPPMTAFRSLLKDEEVAAVLTFVRNTWGNKADPVSAATVKMVREQTAQQTTFWKPDELLATHPLEQALVEAEASATEVFSNKELEEELLNTSLDELVKVAKKRGKARHGKRVFYQSQAACFACHDPPDGAPRVGPDLSLAKETRLTDEELVESILRPSKKIDKEYQQKKILTIDGKVYEGVVVSEDKNLLVLKSPTDPKPIKIPQDDIEEVADSKVSTMPAGLVRELKSRRDFDNLIKYLIKIRN